MKAFYLYILLIATSFFSCHNEQKEKENKIAHLVSEWQGKQIQFPEVHNTAVKELYLKQITGKDSPNKNIPKTTAETTKTEIDFGTFDKSEVKETTIEIKNTGDNPLVIVDVSTTCGCTAATYDKRPAKPGETLRVGIKMTPKDTGFFDEVVTIKYNSINNQPVKVKIKGNVR